MRRYFFYIQGKKPRRPYERRGFWGNLARKSSLSAA